jgi:hypothetical protein
MKVKQFKRANWKAWSELSDTDRNKQIEMLGYIEHLGSSTATDISDWNLLELFGSGEDKLLKLDKGEINTIFFKAREDYIKTVPQTKFEFDDEARERISKITHTIYDSTIRSYQEEIQNIEREIDSHCSSLNDLRQRLLHRVTEVEQLRENPNDKICKEIEKVCEDGFYIFERLTTDNILYMQTAGSIVLRHAGETLDFGRFRIKLRLNHAAVEVLPLENNLQIEWAYPHPRS